MHFEFSTCHMYVCTELMGFWAQFDFVLAIGTELMGFWAQVGFVLTIIGNKQMGFWVHFEF